ncbi:MAG TPA: peptidoglycan DD-metalloendopeptidase family protein [Bauldia sp.]|nr:peptidoglycan DD-metalloendopeptidase family protein [Bauldia sp.]
MTAGLRATHSFARRKPPHRIIIAQGENVRSFTIRPWLIATVGGTAFLFGALYLAATGYLVFRDDLLAASIASKARMQHAYEDRIASLRSDIDRLTSRQLLNQEAVEAEMDRLSDRQAALDARQDSIAGLSQAAKRAGIDPTDIPGATADATPDDPQDNETDGPSDSEVDKDQTSSIAPVQAGVLPLAFAGLRTSGDAAVATQASGPEVHLQAVTASLDALAKDQVAYVDTIASRVSAHTEQIAEILKRLGQRVPPSHATMDDSVGGPLVEIDEDADPETFRTNVDLIAGEIDRYGTIRRIAGQLPLARPMNSPITSGYGARLDPFLGRPAMHTGVDFRAALGSYARATAGGTVITAEYTGGYGNMVEIDHGNGITTRYGHLSEIDVVVGQVVAKDAIIGRTGSTGRSTGPHLHYEVRVDGAAIDPMTYIKAGKELAPLLASAQ